MQPHRAIKNESAAAECARSSSDPRAGRGGGGGDGEVDVWTAARGGERERP